jgi:hypothetical protein
MLYAATFENVTVSAIQDLFEVVASSGGPLRIHAIYLAQTSDVGDAAEEILRVRILRGYTTSGSGGSSVTPTPLRSGGTAFGGTCEANNTTVANTGTPVTCHVDAFNIRAGWVYVPTPETRIEVAASERVVLHLPAAPADAISLSGTLIFEEF